MSYGEIKIDTITFTAGGVDTSIAVSGLVQNPTFTGNITTTGTITADVVKGTTTVSGATVTGTAGVFTVVTGGTAGFTTVTGTTVTGTTANFVTVSGTTVTGSIGQFTNVTGVNIVGTTLVSGATVTGNVGSFTTLTGGTVNLTSGVFASGTAAAPSVSIGTTDNGLYSPGADQVAISTNGTGRLFVDASGRISVANQFTDSSLASNIGGLNVLTAGSSDNNALTFAWNHQNLTTEIEQRIEWLFGDDASANNYKSAGFIGMGKEGTWQGDSVRDSYLAFATTDAAVASEKVRITSAGLVGVGTSSPVSVTGFGTLFTVANNAGGGIVLQDANTTVGYRNKYIASVDGEIHFGKCADDGTSPTTQVLLDHNGRLGVGTTTPGTRLWVSESATGATNGSNDIAVFDRNAEGYIKVLSPNNAVGGIGFGDPDDNFIGAVRYDHASDNLNFFVNNSERARIDSSGRLGIGTSSPNSLLHLAGSSAQDLRIQRTGNIVSAGDTYGAINFVGLTSGGTAPADFSARILATHDSSQPSTTRASVLSFYTNLSSSNASEKMRIDSSGRVGIGTTSPLGNTHIQSSSTGLAAVNSAGDELVIEGGANCGMTILAGNTSTSTIYFADSDSAQPGSLQYTHSDNSLNIRTNNSERARITSSGQLLVGTSSTPVSSTAVLQGRSGAATGEAILRLCRGQDTPADAAVLGDLSFGDSNNGDAARIFAQRDGGTWTSASSRPSRLVFSTTADGASSPTERMRIDSAGQVGIAVAPSVGVRTSIKAGSGGGQALSLLPGGAGDLSVAQLAITKFDNNTTTSQYFVQFNINDGAAASGRIVANGANQAAFASTSDIRLKENIQDLPSQLEKICSLRPVEFDYVESEGGGHQIGFIAQELQTVYPDAVSAGTDENQYLSVTGWSKTEARLVKALQEAVAKIESLEARLTAAGI